MLFKLKCPLPSTHQKLQVSNVEISFGFFLNMESLSPKTINDSNIDLDRFPASKVRQLAKKIESLKAIARHIKAVASDPQVAQVNLIKHERTSCQASPSRNNILTSLTQRRGTQVNTRVKDHPLSSLIQVKHIRDRCSKHGNSKHAEGLKCPARKFQCKTYNKYGHFTSLCYKKQLPLQSRNPKTHQMQVGVVYA